jgi:hypothetical protein
MVIRGILAVKQVVVTLLNQFLNLNLETDLETVGMKERQC